MNDILLRAAVVVAAAATGVAVARLARRRAARRPRPVRMPGLGPGLVLFTSETCDSCAPARAVIQGRFGARGYREVVWERQPGLFDRYAVGKVPTLVWLEADGNGVAWEGIPDDRLVARLALRGPSPGP